MFSEGIIIYDSAGVNTAGVTATNRLKVDVAGETIAITAASLPLPTGAATEATLLSIDNELNTITAALNSIDAGIPVALGQTTMANSMPVVIASDQGNLNVSIAADTLGLALDATVLLVNTSVKASQYAEDDPHGSANVGQFVLAVRNDSPALLTDTDGDYSAIAVNRYGYLYVNDTVTQDNTTSIAAAILQEDAPHASGDRGIMALTVRNDALGSILTSTDGNYSPIAVDDRGAVAIWDGGRSITVDGSVVVSSISSAVTIQDGGGSITVDGSVTVSGTVTATLPANSGVDIGDVTINNAAGGSAVNIQDGGNSITVDDGGTTLSIDDGGSSITIDYATTGSGTATGAIRVELPTNGTGTIATVGAVTAITNALPAGTNRLGSVRIVDSADADQTTAKGTQASRGLGVQQLKDSGRTRLSYYAVAAAAGATTVETAITLTRSTGTSATSTGTSHTPTSGKIFRIEAIVFATRGHNTATAQATTFNLRVNTAGAVTTSSTPIILAVRCATPATANSYDRYIVPIPDGIEITGDGTLQWGVTAAATYTTNAPTWDVTIFGFEY